MLDLEPAGRPGQSLGTGHCRAQQRRGEERVGVGGGTGSPRVGACRCYIAFDRLTLCKCSSATGWSSCASGCHTTLLNCCCAVLVVHKRTRTWPAVWGGVNDTPPHALMAHLSAARGRLPSKSATSSTHSTTALRSRCRAILRPTLRARSNSGSSPSAVADRTLLLRCKVMPPGAASHMHTQDMGSRGWYVAVRAV